MSERNYVQQHRNRAGLIIRFIIHNLLYLSYFIYLLFIQSVKIIIRDPSWFVMEFSSNLAEVSGMALLVVSFLLAGNFRMFRIQQQKNRKLGGKILFAHAATV